MTQTVEKRPREMMLRREFTNAVFYLNKILPPERQLIFIHWDFHKFAKRFLFSHFIFVLLLILYPYTPNLYDLDNVPYAFWQ